MIFPSEPGGGTWVGVNDAGISLALLNWYAAAAPATDPPVSRGLVVRETLMADRPDTAEARLRELPLDRLRPFRLIGFFPGDATVGEWLWDGRRLDHLIPPGTRASGFPPAATSGARKPSARAFFSRPGGNPAPAVWPGCAVCSPLICRPPAPAPSACTGTMPSP